MEGRRYACLMSHVSRLMQVLTHWENMVLVCNDHAPGLGPIDLAEILGGIPIAPPSHASRLKAACVEDAAADAAWQQESCSDDGGEIGRSGGVGLSRDEDEDEDRKWGGREAPSCAGGAGSTVAVEG